MAHPVHIETDGPTILHPVSILDGPHRPGDNARDVRKRPGVAAAAAPLTDAIVRHRKVLWCILIGVYAFAFNGQWRVGKDSALYRGLAHSLASGRGYTFGEFGPPGLSRPAGDACGAGKIFSLAAWPGIIVMHLMAHRLPDFHL